MKKPPKNPNVLRIVKNVNVASTAQLVAATAALGKKRGGK